MRVGFARALPFFFIHLFIDIVLTPQKANHLQDYLQVVFLSQFLVKKYFDNLIF